MCWWRSARTSCAPRSRAIRSSATSWRRSCISAVVTGLAGALLGFQTYLVSAEAVSVPFSGELLAMVVIGGMHHILGPALGALFYILFRELFSIWTANWLLWFGLVFVGFVLFSPERPGRHLGQAVPPLAPAARRGGAMSKRKIYEGLPLPAFLRPRREQGPCSRSKASRSSSAASARSSNASLTVEAGRDPRADRAERRRQDQPVQPGLGLYPPDQRQRAAARSRRLAASPTASHLPRGWRARSRSPTCFAGSIDLREPAAVAAGAASGRFNTWRDIDSYSRGPRRDRRAASVFSASKASKTIEGGELSYGGQRLVDLGIALGSKPQVLLLDEPLAGLAAAERERVVEPDQERGGATSRC